MASLENNEQGSSPRKRQKIESSTSTSTSTSISNSISLAYPPPEINTTTNSITNASSSSSDKMEVDQPSKNLVSEVPLSSRPEHAQEVQSGILHYVNKKNPGFQGILKQRYVGLFFLSICCEVYYYNSKRWLLQFCHVCLSKILAFLCFRIQLFKRYPIHFFHFSLQFSLQLI